MEHETIDWTIPENVFRPKENGFEGRCFFRKADFKFTLNKQTNGPYNYRGTVSAVGKSGKVLTRKKKENRDGMIVKSRIPIQSSISINGTDIDDIKNIVGEKIIKLHKNNAGAIVDASDAGVTADTITPAEAAEKYARNFSARKHPNASEESQRKIAKKVMNICSELPHIPMIRFTKESIEKELKNLGMGTDARKLLCEFWDYCLESQYCEMRNPVTPPPKKKQSDKARQKKAMKSEELGIDQTDRFFELLERNPSGGNCGIALIASGFNAREATGFRWKDIVFKRENDFAIVKYFFPERMGLTHNFSRPLLPQAAEILRARFSALYKEKGQIVMDYPVVSLTAPAKAMKSAQLIQEATRVLREAEISNHTLSAIRREDRTTAAATKLLHNTYKRIIHERCNLVGDSGTALFLLGQSFGTDTTSDGYTAFTCDDASRRMYHILRSVRPVERHRKNLSESVENGIHSAKCIAASSREYTVVNMTVRLKPGEYIDINCLHGVEGTYSVS